jgi:hypothetical protein
MEPLNTNLPAKKVGDIFYGELTLTNYGLVRADHLKQQLPASDAFFRYEFLAEVPSSLAAKERVSLPYRVIALKVLEDSTASANATGGGCYDYSNTSTVTYDSICAFGQIVPGASSTSWTSGSHNSCAAGTPPVYTGGSRENGSGEIGPGTTIPMQGSRCGSVACGGGPTTGGGGGP